MLSFFKINDPSRLILLFVAMVIIRLPYYIHGLDVLQFDLSHMLIGERLANGASLYLSLWDGIAPLSAWGYMLIDFVFGKSIWAYHIIALLIAFVQCVIFNNIIINNRACTENNYLPAAIYAVMISFSYDMLTLSPALMSTTFILLALNNIFRQAELRIKKDEKILSIGIYIGIAALFYLPAAVFGLVAIVALGLFSSTVGRRYMLIIYGFLLPFAFIVLYYFMTDGIGEFYHVYSFKFFNPDRTQYLGALTIIGLSAFPLLFLLFGLVRVFQRSRFSNYQMRLIQMMIFWLLASMLLFFWLNFTLSEYILFVPSVAFFITHYFNLLKGRMKGEIVFWFFIIGSLVVSMGGYSHWFGINRFLNFDTVSLKATPYDAVVKNKAIVVFGEDVSIYKNSELATPFLDWPLSNEVLAHPNYYDNLALIYGHMNQSLPEVIIDLENVMPELQQRIPMLEKSYHLETQGVYTLRE